MHQVLARFWGADNLISCTYIDRKAIPDGAKIYVSGKIIFTMEQKIDKEYFAGFLLKKKPRFFK